MKFEQMTAARPALVRNDGSAVEMDAVIAALVTALKQHGHYGNLSHHMAGGDWQAVTAALRQILQDRLPHDGLKPLARNYIRVLGGTGPANIRPFRDWFLAVLEAESSTLFRRLVERRIDAARLDIAKEKPALRKSALRILTRG